VVRFSLSKLHQNKKTNFGSSFCLSKTEGLGMELPRGARCMALRLVRVWHQPPGCILSYFGLDSILAKARFHTATICGNIDACVKILDAIVNML
jgi:hypothetical protein